MSGNQRRRPASAPHRGREWPLAVSFVIVALVLGVLIAQRWSDREGARAEGNLTGASPKRTEVLHDPTSKIGDLDREVVGSGKPSSDPIRGAVAFEDGIAAAGVLVVARGDGDASEARAGGDGSFALSGLDGCGPYRLRAVHQGFESDAVEAYAGDEGVRLVLSRDFHAIAIRLRAPESFHVAAQSSGLPASEVYRMVSERESVKALDPEGLYVFHLRSGIYDLLFQVGPYNQHRKLKRLTVDCPMVLDLPSAEAKPSVTIDIVDARTGRSIPEVIVSRPGGSATTMTNPFSLEIIESKNIDLIGAEGYRPIRMPSNITEDCTLRLEPASKVVVRITARASKVLPLDARADIEYKLHGDRRWRVVEESLKIGGSEVCIDLYPGDYGFRANLDGEVVATAVATIHEGRTATVVLGSSEVERAPGNGECRLVVTGLPAWAGEQVQVRADSVRNIPAQPDHALSIAISGGFQCAHLSGSSQLFVFGLRSDATLAFGPTQADGVTYDGEDALVVAVPLDGSGAFALIIARERLATYLGRCVLANSYRIALDVEGERVVVWDGANFPALSTLSAVDMRWEDGAPFIGRVSLHAMYEDRSFFLCNIPVPRTDLFDAGARQGRLQMAVIGRLGTESVRSELSGARLVLR